MMWKGTGADSPASGLGELAEYDVRGNKSDRALAESLWAVRVLRGTPDWLADVFWNFLETLQNNTQDGLFPGLGMDLVGAKYASQELRHAGVGIATVINKMEFHFKLGFNNEGTGVGMDSYIDSRTGSPYVKRGVSCQEESSVLARVICSTATGHTVTMCNRKRAVRSEFFFRFRGRAQASNEYLLDREASWNRQVDSSFASNSHAGITMVTDLNEELTHFFPCDIYHGGKAENQNDMNAWEYRAFQVPFIGGASGSILYAALAMEDTVGGQMPHGVVPLEQREVLLGLLCAALVAAGQHSLGECILVLQAMGYFSAIPELMLGGSYLDSVASFEQDLKLRGLVPLAPHDDLMSSPLSELQYQSRVTHGECWAVEILSNELRDVRELLQLLYQKINESEPVLLKGASPNDDQAKSLLKQYEKQLDILWEPAFAYVEVGTCDSDPLELFQLAASLPSEWIDEGRGGRNPAVLHASILLNMLGQADKERLKYVISESPAFEVELTSVHVAQVLKATDSNCYVIEAVFSSPGIRKLKEQFFCGLVVKADDVYKYMRKSRVKSIQCDLNEEGSTCKYTYEDPDIRSTLAYIRKEYVSVAMDLLQHWRCTNNTMPVETIILETGRPNARVSRRRHSKFLPYRGPQELRLSREQDADCRAPLVNADHGTYCRAAAVAALGITAALVWRLQTRHA